MSKLSEIKQETEEREGKGVTLVIGRDASRGRRIKGERERGRERERASDEAQPVESTMQAGR